MIAFTAGTEYIPFLASLLLLEIHISVCPASKPSFLNPGLIITVNPMHDSTCTAECSVVLKLCSLAFQSLVANDVGFFRWT